MKDSTRRLRPMGIADILDETVELYKTSFVLLVGIAAVVVVVAAVCTKLDLPSPLVLIVVGVAGSYVPFIPDVVLEPEVVLSGLLKKEKISAAAVGAFPYHCSSCGACTDTWEAELDRDTEDGSYCGVYFEMDVDILSDERMISIQYKGAGGDPWEPITWVWKWSTMISAFSRMA